MSTPATAAADRPSGRFHTGVERERPRCGHAVHDVRGLAVLPRSPRPRRRSIAQPSPVATPRSRPPRRCAPSAAPRRAGRARTRRRCWSLEGSSSEQHTNESTSVLGSTPASNEARSAASNISSLYETPAVIGGEPPGRCRRRRPSAPRVDPRTVGPSIVPRRPAGMPRAVATSSDGLRRMLWAALLLGLALAYGVTGYMLLEGWPFLDALYMTVTTFHDGRLREVRPLDDVGRVFTLSVSRSSRRSCSSRSRSPRSGSSRAIGANARGRHATADRRPVGPLPHLRLRPASARRSPPRVRGRGAVRRSRPEGGPEEGMGTMRSST